MKNFCLPIGFLLIALLIMQSSVNVFSQSKKEIKKNGIKSIKITVTDTRTGNTFNESFTKFDSNANIVEEKSFDNEGNIKKQETYKYDNNNNKTEEVCFDKYGKQTEKNEFKYNAYGEKTEENVYDENYKLKNKNIFSYDKNGMKREKKTYDAAGNLISIKKYVYEY